MSKSTVEGLARIPSSEALDVKNTNYTNKPSTLDQPKNQVAFQMLHSWDFRLNTYVTVTMYLTMYLYI